MAINISTEELLKKTGSIFKLVILASKRALELNDGAPKLIKTCSDKSATVALEEILAGKVTLEKKNEEEE
ncbi:MAG: DNA-directed RNA polymerase subunit omega [Candidatus Omnitrophica bacterium]|nr:DNA-directed RNA polymerase subunit omega [Candidatus Omnitrophota bacterium]